MAFENRLMKKIPAFESGLVETRQEGVFEESAAVDETDGNNSGGGIFVDKNEFSPGIAMTSDSFEYRDISRENFSNFVKFTIQAQQPNPTPKDYEKGYFFRYFIKRYDSDVVEVLKEQLDSIGSELAKSPELYKTASLRWTLVAEKVDFPDIQKVKDGQSPALLLKIMEVGELNQDVAKINKRYTMIADKKCPGIEKYINGAYSDFTISGPGSIEGNLYTSGNEYYLPNGNEYIGYYHKHSIKGPMVGRTHTEKAHDQLIHKSELSSKNRSSSIAMPKPQQKKVSYLYESPTQMQTGGGGSVDSGMDGGSAPAPSSGGGGGSGGY